MPELDAELEKVWQKELKLTPGDAISFDTKKKLFAVLGKEGLDKVPKMPNAKTIQTIYENLIDTRRSIAHIVPLDKTPDQKITTSSTSGGRTTEKKQVLSDVVTNADSKEAQAVLWIFNNVATSANRDSFSEVFERLGSADIKNVRILERMKEIHGALLADPNNKGLGLEGTIPGSPPFTVSGGSGAIKKEQGKICVQMALIHAGATGKPLATAHEAIAQSEAKILELETQKKSLRSSLDELNALGQQLSPKANNLLSVDLDFISENFGANAFSSKMTNTVDILPGNPFGKSHSVGDWITGGDLKKFSEKARFGNRPPSAAYALDQLMRLHFEPDIKHLTKEQKDAFYAEMKKVLTGSNPLAAPATPAVAPSAAPIAPSSPSRGFTGWLKDSLQGQGSLLNPVAVVGKTVQTGILGRGSAWNPVSWPAKTTKWTVGSLLGKGSTANPITWPARTLKNAWNNKGWAAGGGVGGALLLTSTAINPLFGLAAGSMLAPLLKKMLSEDTSHAKP